MKKRLINICDQIFDFLVHRKDAPLTQLKIVIKKMEIVLEVRRNPTVDKNEFKVGKYLLRYHYNVSVANKEEVNITLLDDKEAPLYTRSLENNEFTTILY